MFDTPPHLHQDPESRARDIFIAWLRDSDATPPTTLWHYTNALGLQGIMHSQSMWATDSRYLNDATEIQFGTALFLSVLNEQDLDSRDLITRNFITGLCRGNGKVIRDFLADNVSFHVVCFCSEGDLLSQWRAYGGSPNGDGAFAIGFTPRRGDARSWAQTASELANDVFLRRVLYDRDEQKAACRRLFEPLVDLLDESSSEIPTQNAFSAALIDGLVELSCWCKDPAFSEENEWRIVYQRRHSPVVTLPIRVRPARDLFIPYVELDLASKVGARHEQMPVSHIRCGPNAEGIRSEFGIRQLLSLLPGVWNDVEVDSSSTPLRW